MFTDQGQCFFGQCGAAQTHLERQGVCEGDVFLFFGLFRDFQNGGEPHHRIFAYLEVEKVMPLADNVPQELLALSHPHALAMHHKNDVVYQGIRKRIQPFFLAPIHHIVFMMHTMHEDAIARSLEARYLLKASPFQPQDKQRSDDAARHHSENLEKVRRTEIHPPSHTP